MRADVILVEMGLAESRQKAKGLIEAGNVYFGGAQVKKAAAEIDPARASELELRGETMPYVSRGGYKLEEALRAFSIDVCGLICVDFGASTGGFTDCLLQHGAAKVIAVDSGRDQLHPRLRDDARVTCMENCNARYLTAEAIGGEKADLAVCDLSFISQTKIYAAVNAVLKDGGCFVSLIKPQFEAGREYLNKHGVVRDVRVHERVKQMIRDEAARAGFLCLGMTDSPILGGDGNKEFLAFFKKVENASEKTEGMTDGH